MDCYELALSLGLTPPEYLRGKEFLYKKLIEETAAEITKNLNEFIAATKPGPNGEECAELAGMTEQEKAKNGHVIKDIPELAPQGVTLEQVKRYMQTFYLGSQVAYEKRKLKLKDPDLAPPDCNVTLFKSITENDGVRNFNFTPRFTCSLSGKNPRIKTSAASMILTITRPELEAGRMHSSIAVSQEFYTLLTGAEEMLHYLQYRESPAEHVKISEKFQGRSENYIYMFDPLEIEAGKQNKEIISEFGVGRFSFRYLHNSLRDKAIVWADIIDSPIIKSSR